MARVAPVSLRFVLPELTGEVPSPPHDALSVEARRDHLRDHPRSYLGVTRAPDDVDDDSEDPNADVLAAGRRFLDALLADGVFSPATGPSFFIYRLELAGHCQTGLVCGVATEDYDTGVVRIHERINHVRAAHLARHLRVVGAQSSPIALAFNGQPGVTDIMSRAAEDSTPILDFEDDSGLRQQVWALSDPDDVEQVSRALRDIPLYLIDGHHRAAAASEDRAALSPPPKQHLMLATLFPYEELRSEAFHRVIVGVDLADFESRIGERFSTRYVDDPKAVAERSDRELALAIPGDTPDAVRWLLVDVPFDLEDTTGLNNIDPVRLGHNLLGPLLDIEESGSDRRLSYRPGMADFDAIATTKLREGEALFLMRPVPATTLMSVSDAGMVMPPKSTYFQPKVRSGLFIRTIDEP